MMMAFYSGFRWRAKEGRARNKVERASQFTWSHRIILYVAIVTTLTLVFQVLGLHPLGGLLD